MFGRFRGGRFLSSSLRFFLCLSLSAWIYRSADRPWTHRRGWRLECEVRMWACAVKVNSEAADLFMSCGAFVNFSAGVAWSDPHYTSLCLCARASVCVCVCVSVFVCLCVRPITVSQRNVFSCRLSSFTAPVSLSSPLHHSISSSLSPPVLFFFFFFFPCSSLF